MTDTPNLLRGCGLFRGLDATRIDALIGGIEEITFPARAEILREGDYGDAMYMVLAGAVQVYTYGNEGREIVLARLESGDYFGEQALLPGSSGRRNASVRAAEAVNLARIPRNVFQSVLAENDALRERIADIGAEQVRSNLQQLSPLARGIGLNAAASSRRNLAAGEALFQQGDEADALYFVSTGRLNAWRDDNGERTLIGTIERGGCVGELALIRRDRRSATVIAEEESEVVAIPRSAFDQAYRGSAAVRELLVTLQRAYELPQRGILTQHAGTFAGQECVTTIYHLHDGGVFAAHRVVGRPLYALERLGAKAAETLTWADREQSRELRLDSRGMAIGITARGEWPDVHAFHSLVLDGGRIGSEDRQEFARSGRFTVASARVAANIICHCVNVTDDRLRSCIRQGAATFTRLQEITGCGTVCGGCIPAVTEMLGADEWVLADVVAEVDEAADIRSFDLVPRDSAYPEAQPGQHIVVEGMVGGLRLRRPYTLSSSRPHGGRLRITVKREPGGAFSPWLFNRRTRGEPLRITRPRGEYVIDLTRGAPAVCMVAGIGVTPAVAAAKTLETLNRPALLLVHYSGRSRDSMACLPELEAAAQRSDVELIVRETAQQGRVELPEIEKLATRFPRADWYLCGPSAYLHEVAQMLKRIRVSPDRIHVEAFTPVGSPKATEEERTAFKRYLLVPPQPQIAPRHARVLLGVGRSVWAFANSSVYPLKWLEKRLGRAARLDASVPMEYLAIVSALSWGPFQYQLHAFSRLDLLRSSATERVERTLREKKSLPADTPDGNTFAYWMPAAPFPKFPEKCRVDTGWTKVGEGKFVPVYVTRSRTVLEHLLRSSDHSDRGPLPYHYFQQTLGRTDIPSCPGRKATGLFGGQLRDNATWTEDRALTTDIFGFSTIDHFGPLMAAAAEEVCRTVDEVVAHDPEAVIDLNIMLSKVAYTIIVRAAFGNVDLAEMHALGRTLSEAIRKSFAYLWEFVMGRQSIPEDYADTLEAARLTNQKMIDLLRQLDREGRLSEAQRSVRLVRMILETADEPGGAYERLYALLMPLVIAGHETTGHAMSWAVYEMSRNPRFEKLLLAEIEDFRASHGGRPITTEDYDERPLSWSLLAECLRRHAPIQSIPRTTTEDGVVPPDPETGIGGFRYPAGAMVVFSIIGVHLDPVRWGDPLEFRPERWMEGVRDEMSTSEKGRLVRANMRAREQAADWQPFSDGPGRCPGQHFNAHEFFVVMDALLPRYRFEFEYPNATVPHSSTMVVGPEVGRMSVRIRRR